MNATPEDVLASIEDELSAMPININEIEYKVFLPVMALGYLRCLRDFFPTEFYVEIYKHIIAKVEGFKND